MPASLRGKGGLFGSHPRRFLVPLSKPDPLGCGLVFCISMARCDSEGVGARLFPGVCGRAQLAPTGGEGLRYGFHTPGISFGTKCRKRPAVIRRACEARPYRVGRNLGSRGDLWSPAGVHLFPEVCGRAQLAPTGCIRTLGCRGDQWSPAGGAVVSRGLRASTARPYRGRRATVRLSHACGVFRHKM